MDDLIRDFVVETLEALEVIDAELVRFEREPDAQPVLATIFRLLHTVKGACGFLGLPRLEVLAHGAEGLIERFRGGASASRSEVTLVLKAVDRIKSITLSLLETGREPGADDEDILIPLRAAASGRAAEPEPPPVGETPAPPPGARHADDNRDAAAVARQSVRVSVARLDQMMTVVSELVLVRNQMAEIARRADAGPFKAPLQRLSHITGELQDGVMRARMQHIGAAWSKLSRIVRDLAVELGKDIRIETIGADTEIDRQILEALKDCVVHLVRNAACHGVERRQERIDAGKPAQGLIRLTARREGSQIIMEIDDDGAGLDVARLRTIAAARGLRTPEQLAAMTDGEAAMLILEPGFSTVTELTNLSGRGMGLDAVRAAIEAVRGRIDLINRPGAGLTLILKLPLTLAIAAALIVEVCGQRFALPQGAVVELVRAQPGSDTRIEHLSGAMTLRLREGLTPLIDLGALLGLCVRTPPDGGLIAICRHGPVRFGILVDALHQTEEIVVKPVSVRLRSLTYFGGATILGDGSVALILEPAGLAAVVGRVGEAAPAAAPAAQDEGPAPAPLLLFRAGGPALKAAPLATVARLEEVDPARIEHFGGRAVLRQGERFLRLRRLDGQQAPGAGGGSLQVVVFSDGRQSIGLIVDEIVDVVEERLSIDAALADDGMLGALMIGGRAAEMFDVAAMFAADAPEYCADGGQAPVLLIESAPFFQALLEPALGAAGYRVIVASSALEALERGAGTALTAVVVDLDGENAGEELAAAAARSAGAGAPLIGLTSRGGAAARAGARAAGACAVLGKFDRRSLLALLAQRQPLAEAAA